MKQLLAALSLAAAAAFAATPADAAKAYQAIDVTDGGTITGSVLRGEAEAQSERFTVSKNPEVCGTGTREVAWVRANGAALLDAVVYLEAVDAGKPFLPETGKVVIDQKECSFAPYLQVMANGGEIEAVNSDPIAHNIHIYELIGRARRTVINVSQPEQGTITKKIKLRRGVAMKIECDQHDFMHGFIFAARNPYYAVVDDAGGFTITDVPPGTYVIKVWHGRLGEREATVEVAAGATARIDFTY